MRRLQFCLAVFAVLALTMGAFAQVQNGQLTGTVSDPSGAAIANAKVTVINPATGVNLSATTNSTGNYTVPFTVTSLLTYLAAACILLARPPH